MLAHQRERLVAFGAAAGLLFASCDKNVAGPSPPPPVVNGPPVARSTGPIAFVSDRDGTTAIYLANEDGSTVTRLTEGSRPAWSPDGRRLAFGHNQGIHVINVDGSNLRRLAFAQGWDPDWSPDGRTLVFRPSCCDVTLVDIDGSNQRRLFDSKGLGSFTPKWSHNGERIVFTVGTFFSDFKPIGMWSINPDGSGAQHLGFDGEWPAWSPDGSQIAMVTRLGIEVINADGSGQRLRVAGEMWDVDWTPDGRLIYTRKFPGIPGREPSRIFISEGGVERQLITDATSAARPDYSDHHVTWVR